MIYGEAFVLCSAQPTSTRENYLDYAHIHGCKKYDEESYVIEGKN